VTTDPMGHSLVPTPIRRGDTAERLHGLGAVHRQATRSHGAWIRGGTDRYGVGMRAGYRLRLEPAR
jgi:hypothetical protein